MVNEKTCEICGYAIKPEDLVVHRIIPEEVAKQTGILDTRKVVLCTNCSDDIQAWYHKKVYDMTYDTGTKQFIPKSATEIVKEYEAAYKAFVARKRQLQT